MQRDFALRQDDRLTRQGRDARARGDAAGDVEGVGRGQDKRLLVWLFGGGPEKRDNRRAEQAWALPPTRAVRLSWR
jgi:hypothetical protein